MWTLQLRVFVGYLQEPVRSKAVVEVLKSTSYPKHRSLLAGGQSLTH